MGIFSSDEEPMWSDVFARDKEIEKLKQENEVYKLSEQEAKEIIAELEHKNKKLNTQNAGLQATLREWDRFNKYRKTLEEIRNIAETPIINDNNRFKQIITKINEALND